MRRVPPEERHRASSAQTALRNCKVRVTIYLDADVVGHFKRRAALPNAAPYQTQINCALRRFVVGDGARPGPDYSHLLEDDRFLEAVAERLRARG